MERTTSTTPESRSGPRSTVAAPHLSGVTVIAASAAAIVRDFSTTVEALAQHDVDLRAIVLTDADAPNDPTLAPSVATHLLADLGLRATDVEMLCIPHASLTDDIATAADLHQRLTTHGRVADLLLTHSADAADHAARTVAALTCAVGSPHHAVIGVGPGRAGAQLSVLSADAPADIEAFFGIIA